MTTNNKSGVSKYRLAHNEWGTGEEYLDKLIELIEEPLQCMQQMDGDMYLSDYQKLIRASWLIQNRGE